MTFEKKPENEPNTPGDPASAAFERLEGDPPTEKDDALDALTKKLEAEKDARKEERFVWIVVSTILVDVLWFRNSQNATLPIVVLILDLVVLLVLARRMDIEELVQLMNKVLYGIGQKGAGG